MGADCDPPVEQWAGPARKGPSFSQVPWPSVAACEIATLAISAALRARELTGRGQHIETSLLQGVLATTVGAWHRVEKLIASGAVVLDPLVTDVSPLSAWETSFARTRKADGLKLMLDPRMDA